MICREGLEAQSRFYPLKTLGLMRLPVGRLIQGHKGWDKEMMVRECFLRLSSSNKDNMRNVRRDAKRRSSR